MSISNRLIAYVCSIVIVCATFVQAHRDMESSSAMRGFKYLGVGAAWIDNSAGLNNFLTTLGISPFDKTVLNLALGRQTEMGQWIGDCNVSGALWARRLNGNLRTSLGTADLLLNLGYNIMPQENPMSLFPYVGVGPGFNFLAMRANTQTFAEAGIPHASPFFWQAKLLFNLGIGWDLVMTHKDNAMRHVLGIRAGYILDESEQMAWMENGTKVSDLPTFRQTGVYVRLVLGGGGLHHHGMK